MFIRELNVSGYRNLNNTTILFNKGLNVLIGENATGKSNIIDSLRLLLFEDDYGHLHVSDSDFYSPFNDPAYARRDIRISALFSKLSEEEIISFLPWTTEFSEMKLNLDIDNSTNKRGRYNKIYWGGESSASAFEWELLNSIECVYLPPLRDAEAKLKEGRSSRLARLLRIMSKEELLHAKDEKRLHPLEAKVKKFNEELASESDEVIFKANNLIRESLKKALGDVFSQDTQLQFSEVNFNRIVENLRLLFYPNVQDVPLKEDFRSLSQNSLGYNNLLYIATILAELMMIENRSDSFKVLLIEEPEAHLHPQLQTKLINYLVNSVEKKNIQIVVTTHSTTIASSVSLKSLIHLSLKDNTPNAVSLSDCDITKQSLDFLDRWIDVTKSTMLFAKGIILVEGIAEAILLDELALNVLKDYNTSNNRKIPNTLDEAGVTVVNMNGIYFKHFMQLYHSKIEGKSFIPVRCSGITDNDPPKKSYPTPDNLVEGNNPALKLITEYNETEYCRLYSSKLKTLEYDLAMENDNLAKMLFVLSKSWYNDNTKEGYPLQIMSKLLEVDWLKASNGQKKDAARQLLKWIENSNIGKGYYAQRLSLYLKYIREKKSVDEVNLSVPEYIKEAVIWACGGESNV